MRESPRQELWVGLFVLVGIAAVAYLSIAIGNLRAGGGRGLEITATFDEIGGLKPRARVVVGGVKVGQVKAIDLADDFRARVTLDVDDRLALPADTSASILTSGVLGDQYVALEPGGDPTTLAAGDEIQFTQSAVVLERLIGKLIQNLGSGSSGDGGGEASDEASNEAPDTGSQAGSGESPANGSDAAAPGGGDASDAGGETE
jgi:phospholipid/cholesterol/gamma-HCH transport system substrate-binding protein